MPRDSKEVTPGELTKGLMGAKGIPARLRAAKGADFRGQFTITITGDEAGFIYQNDEETITMHTPCKRVRVTIQRAYLHGTQPITLYEADIQYPYLDHALDALYKRFFKKHLRKRK